MQENRLETTKIVSLVQNGIQSPLFVEVLRPNQPDEVMLSVVSLPNHSFTRQA